MLSLLPLSILELLEFSKPVNRYLELMFSHKNSIHASAIDCIVDRFVLMLLMVDCFANFFSKSQFLDYAICAT